MGWSEVEKEALVTRPAEGMSVRWAPRHPPCLVLVRITHGISELVEVPLSQAYRYQDQEIGAIVFPCLHARRRLATASDRVTRIMVIS